MPKTADRLSYEVWAQQGKKTALDHAVELYPEILAAHKPHPLTAEQEATVEGILQEARDYYRQKGAISDAEWAAYSETLQSPTYPWK